MTSSLDTIVTINRQMFVYANEISAGVEALHLDFDKINFWVAAFGCPEVVL